MRKIVCVLIVSSKGDLLMRREADGRIAAFGGLREEGDAPVRAAVRVLGEETGLDVRAEDLEFLGAYASDAADMQVFIVAGVDSDRVHAYGDEESLCKVHRSDDFEDIGLTAMARKYVIDYFKKHKRA